MKTLFVLGPITAKTKGEVRRLRNAGLVPVSLQHKGAATLHFQQEAKPLNEYLKQYGEATLLDMVIVPENRKCRAMVQNLQRDPVTHQLVQVTFQLLSADDKMKTSVQLVFHGVPEVVTNNEATLQHPLDRLEIECAQADLPDHITVDVAHIGHGEAVRVSDLPADPRYRIITPGDTVLATVKSVRTGGDPGQA